MRHKSDAALGPHNSKNLEHKSLIEKWKILQRYYGALQHNGHGAI